MKYSIKVKFKKFFGCFSDDGDCDVETFRPMLFNYFLTIVFFLVLFTSFYRVGSDELATIWLFGKDIGVAEPGAHLKLPWPIMKVHSFPVQKIQRQEIGFRTVDVDKGEYKDIPAESEMLTADNNIANVTWTNRFKISDVRKWQYTVASPEKLLNFITQASMRLQVGRSKFDSILTVKKLYTQQEAFKSANKIIKELDFGVSLQSILLQDVSLPGPVRASFTDVENAKQDRERLKQQGMAYYNKVVPEAMGRGSEIINEAMGFKAEVVGEAKKKVSEFRQLYSEYKRHPQITKTRMRNETLQKILPGSKIYYLNNNNTLNLFNLNNNQQNNNK